MRVSGKESTEKRPKGKTSKAEAKTSLRGQMQLSNIEMNCDDAENGTKDNN